MGDARRHLVPDALDGDGHADADVGSVNPVYVELPGATPSKMILQVSKDGHLYILDAAALGGSAAPKVDYMFAASGMSIHGTPAAYKTAMGQYFVVEHHQRREHVPGRRHRPRARGAEDLGGEPAGADGRLVLGDRRQRVDRADRDDHRRHQQRRSSGSSTTPTRSRALDGDTGTQIYNSSTTCASVQRWTSPIALNNKIVVGGNGHLCSWSLP